MQTPYSFMIPPLPASRHHLPSLSSLPAPHAVSPFLARRPHACLGAFALAVPSAGKLPLSLCVASEPSAGLSPPPRGLPDHLIRSSSTSSPAPESSFLYSALLPFPPLTCVVHPSVSCASAPRDGSPRRPGTWSHGVSSSHGAVGAPVGLELLSS